MTEEKLNKMFARMIQKKPMEIWSIVICLIDAMISKGFCSPNDVHLKIKKLDNPKNVGLAFKIIRAFGAYQTDARVKPVHRRSNGRKVFVWKIDSRYQIEWVRNKMKKRLEDVAKQAFNGLQFEPSGQALMTY